MALIRILKELALDNQSLSPEYLTDNEDKSEQTGFFLQAYTGLDKDGNPIEPSIRELIGKVKLHKTSLYCLQSGNTESRIIGVKISLYPDYPFKPQLISLKEPILHPMIHTQTGRFCHPHLHDCWAPALTIYRILGELSRILNCPDGLPEDIIDNFKGGRFEEMTNASLAALATTDLQKYTRVINGLEKIE